MAISRLQAALGMVTNEVTVAAAQINFDFTLVKNEAPKEYHLLGESLSRTRKDEAEKGQIHITARRLGALFDGVCPPTPKLMKAYGIRVSETSTMAKDFSLSGSETSMFAQFFGIDGRSIWAAATSSTSALQVQLLACMLARLFDAPESISVWVELVKGRRGEIATRFENSEEIHFSILSAAIQTDITRAQLAEWDTSARAWLRTADSLKSKEQKQLLLILDNLGLPVNEDVHVYSSVISAWKASLATMENLVSGIPQAVEDGAAILGLAAWHIYPDMVVLGSENTNLLMNDANVPPGGVLTVGLQRPVEISGLESKRGIYWSLSLAHLRYYGHPVLKQRELSSDTSRVTFDQFSQAVFGCIIGNWGVSQQEISLAVDIILAIADTLERSIEGTSAKAKDISRVLNAPHWFKMIAGAARDFNNSSGHQRAQITKLIQLGLRRRHSFMPIPQSDWAFGRNAFFNLKDEVSFVRCLKSVEERIRYLRLVASRISGMEPASLLIRFRWRNAYAYATAIPTRNPFLVNHKRWYPNHSETQKVISKRGKLVFIPARDGRNPGLPSTGSRFFVDEIEPTTGHSENQSTSEIPTIVGESCYESAADEFLNDNDFFLKLRPVGGPIRFNFVSGDFDTAGLFLSQKDEHFENSGIIFPEEVPSEDILQCLKEDMFSLDNKRPSLLTAIDGATTNALKVLSVASTIYMGLPGATLDITTLNQEIVKTQWAEACLAHEDNKSGCVREVALACIAFFETGKSDVTPSHLKDAFAMSSGDSIYISEQLLRDPWDITAGYKFKRALGNIGRPGVTMLIPPQNPMIREIDPGSWKIINNAPFNNVGEDHFGKTSLHLSFTEYYRPLDLSLRGEQDVRVGLLECIVSVHDAGKWVADVDILAAIESNKLVRISNRSSSGNANSCNKVHTKGMISLENWDEILDIPGSTISVVRARGNPSARLAAACVLAQLRGKECTRRIGICPPKGVMCPNCLSQIAGLDSNVLIH